MPLQRSQAIRASKRAKARAPSANQDTAVFLRELLNRAELVIVPLRLEDNFRAFDACK